ncbi:hypothetical protein [Aequorivita echinoideorum]|uniref:Uncharacterized protein n=1 Tax=Aequorivita echinoideorum TaxID=1549647 RepID=A0ABS5S2E4_9FLAO|nr:hypothetical protein [Aequorivita echinoideorum]MBT0607173.1 hypothetical protein [Aequorivita echinoideorum]
MKLDLEKIENELKNRCHYHYEWGQKQNDIWDARTNFIYETTDWEMLIEKIKNLITSENLDKKRAFNYAANRWFNFWSAMAVEQIFSEMPQIEKVPQSKDHKKDFYFCGIPFDHKTSVFPKHLKCTFEEAKNSKRTLIDWFYKNQSNQKRNHFHNRLFVVVFDKNGAHWKLKAEIGLLKNAIEAYVSNFKMEQLEQFNFTEETQTVSDVIFVNKNN